MVPSLLARLPSLLHHGAPPADTTPFRAWLGQTGVHQTSVAFHAIGALLVSGGLVAIMVMRWWGTTERSDLRWKTRDGWLRFAILGGWTLNFIGGLMRLYEPDHPGIQGVTDTAWMQVLVAKHLALLGALWLSLLAIDLGPRRWTADPPQKAFFAVVLVIVSAVLGGVASGLTLPGVAAEGELEQEDPQGAGDAVIRQVWTNSTVMLTGTPVAGDTQEVPFHVSESGTEVLVVVTWTNARAQITGRLFDPAGNVVDERTRGDDPLRPTTSLELAAYADEVVPGQWKVTLSAGRAVQESAAVAIRVTESSLGLRVLEDTATIAAAGFLELNFYMDEGDWFNYTWQVEDGGPAIEWDIHSHPDEVNVNTHVSGTDTQAEGNFTAGPDGIYSILWIAPDDQEVKVTYRVAGIYRVHSITGR